MKLIFVSGDTNKLNEAEKILATVGVSVVLHPLHITELQLLDAEEIARDKARAAFEQLGRPLFVEHTSLKLDVINGMPGGLTQIFWDALEADKFASVFGDKLATKATAETILCYIDGRQKHVFKGSIKGSIAPKPRGLRAFQWDCVFVPDYGTETFAEMGDRKNDISMRRMALMEFAEYLKAKR